MNSISIEEGGSMKSFIMRSLSSIVWIFRFHPMFDHSVIEYCTVSFLQLTCSGTRFGGVDPKMSLCRHSFRACKLASLQDFPRVFFVVLLLSSFFESPGVPRR